MGKQWQILFPWAPKITADSDCSHEIKRFLLLGSIAMTNLDSILNSRDSTLLTKVHSQSYGFFPVVMSGCESWTIKKADPEELMHWTVVLQKTLESPLDCKEIKPVHPKGNQPRIFTGRTDAEAEVSILCVFENNTHHSSPNVKSWLIGKDPDAG